MKKFLYAASLVVLSIALGVVALSTANKRAFSTSNEATAGGYTLTLNSSNCSFIPAVRKSAGQSDSNNSPSTTMGNKIVFKYTFAMRKSGYAMNLSSSTGSISNITALTGLYSIMVNYTNGECQLSFGNNVDSYTTSTNIESGVRYDVSSATHFKITAVGSANTNITSITAKYLCDVQEDLPPVMSHTHHGIHYLAKEPTGTTPGNREFYTCDECQYVSLVKEDDGEKCPANPTSNRG